MVQYRSGKKWNPIAFPRRVARVLYLPALERCSLRFKVIKIPVHALGKYIGAQPAALSCDFYFAFSCSWIDR